MARVKIGNVFPTDEYLLARCAPAGHGLGGDLPIVDKAGLDNWTSSGWRIYYDEINPDSTLGSVAFVNCKGNNSSITGAVVQEAYKQDRYGVNILTREYTGGEWEPWEWFNPPMQVGVEYRTTERWQGKPVYYKVVDFGGLPNATTATVPIGAENIEWVFLDLSKSWAGPASNLTTNYMTNWANITDMIVSNGQISITTNANMTGTLAYITVKYTKTTD